MSIDTLTPWLPIIAAAAAVVAIIVAAGKAMLTVSRAVKARRVRKVVAIVTPLIDIRLQEVDTALLNLRLEQGETKKVVDEVKAIVSDGLQDDVAAIRKEQHRVADRIDRIYDHLIPD